MRELGHVMSDGRLLDYKQAAAYLNVGKSTIYALVSMTFSA